MVNNPPFSYTQHAKVAFLKFWGPAPCLQQLMILLQMSELQQLQFCFSKWETDKKQWRVTNSFGNKTWRGAYYCRQLHASQGHSIDSSTDLNDPRIYLPFSFSLLSPSNENTEKVIITKKLPQSSFKKKKNVWFILWLGSISLHLDSKGEQTEIYWTGSLCLPTWHQSLRSPSQGIGLWHYYIGGENQCHTQFSESL